MKKSYKYLIALFFLLFILNSIKVNAHAVQLGYCTNCNGDLRIWIEHWHGGSFGYSSLTVTITVNGVPTTVTGSTTLASPLNTPAAALPGCFTPLTVFSTCSQANSYNEWVAYDFPSVTCGVPINVTVTSNGATTIYTQAGCGGFYPASTGNFTIPCATNQLPNVDTCAGNTVGPFTFPTGNTWTNDNPSIGLPASGSGNLPAFVPANTSTTQVANIVVTNLCGSATFSITVYPGPISSFIPNVGCPGFPVSFTENSNPNGSNIIGWQWDFGDGSPLDNTQNPPPHLFPPGGPFNVMLTTTTANGCTHDTIISVDPQGGLVANFAAPSVCDGSPSIFTDTSTPLVNITNWAWDFDNNGTVDDTNQNSGFTFAGPGTYNVELLITGAGGCFDSITIPIVVNPNPVANFSGTSECVGTVTTFNDLSNILTGTIISWQWDFGDLSTIVDTSNLQNPTYTYPAPGSYNATLTVTSDSGCIDVLNVNVDVFSHPVANFTPNTACAGANSLFTDISALGSIGLQFWSWDFDNDAIVDDSNQNPSYIFPGGVGIYPVNLNIIDSNGCFHDTTINVSVSAQPTAVFTFTNECFGSATSFADLSLPNGGTITQWDWDFQNDGTVDNTAQNPTNGYPSAGTYTAELLVTTALGCVDSTTMQVVVDPVPVASFTASNECVGTATTIVNNSSVLTGAIIGWQWDYGDALGTSIIQNPAPYTYASSGNYTITLTVTSDSGCTNTTTVNIDVYNMPTAAFAVNNECLNVAASFTDNSNGNGGVITNWDWDFDGNGATDDINQNPTNLFPSDGIYNVGLIVSTAFGCADTIVQPIEIYPIPVANFSFINACYGTGIAFTDLSTVSSANTPNNITAWNWSFGNSNTSIVQSPAENYASEGVYNVELIVTTNNGCQDTLTQNIEVWPIPVANFTPTEVCLNAISQFNDLTTVSNLNTPNTIVQWSWDFGDGVGVSGNQNPVYGYTADGIYPANFSVVSNNGCTHDTTINVTVNPLPQVIFGDPTSGCAPNMCVTFVNNTTINTAFQPTASISSWSWDFGDGDMSSSMSPTKCYQNSSYSVLDNFDVTLTAISDKQCTTTVIAPSMITVYPKPLADFSYTPDNADIYDTEIIFTDNSIIASIWNWDFGDGTTSNANNPVHEYPDSGSYDVVLYMENIYGCKDTARRIVIIDPVFAIWIPNVFTPDGDGINDLFFSKVFGILELQTLIFDRWGELLFEGYALDSQWGGYYKGVEVQEDVYVYKIRARDVFDEWHEFVGRVTLLK